MTPAPRLFGIPAAAAPVIAILRRGPSRWCHVGRLDLDTLRYEPGAWLRGALYPQKCDLSPDGRWFLYSALKGSADWKAGTVYEAVSRLPWLHALAAWEIGTTYTRGMRFTDEPGVCDIGTPDVGDARPLLTRYGLRLNRAEQFAVERRNGWTEAEDSEPRSERDTWDEQREVRMVKDQPGGALRLRVEGSFAAFRDSPSYRGIPVYALERDGSLELFEDAQWADWDARGRLVIATTGGRLQVRSSDGAGWRTLFDEDLARLRPDPQPPPAWAHDW